MTSPDLQQSMALSVLGVGFATAFLHAALPTHWLPFVLVGRGQRWSLSQVLGAVTAAGLAHIATTALAGGLIVAAGLAMDQWMAGLLPNLSAALLFLFGAFYLGRALLRQPVMGGGPALELSEPTVSHAAAFWGLVALMAVSPGEVLLPIYLSQATEGAVVLGGLTLAFAAGTVLGMSLFTLLARAGWSVLRLERWARYEGVILGLALLLIGLLVLLRQH
ncbi:hypothetical protein [Brevundimonas viscosa]|uniref:Threonine/homoserine/homoserine lactone efflux protein n=1 Tax=Brevundimonas viscosa TaxID=871741 RepID=A0A1I6T5I8_9CAUL|nr:hypothetical protein [Brevundimonas viscosa]SFS84298.1 hypothetical protein SAMN05192570_2964 [Brevundimonas viscosa]